MSDIFIYIKCTYESTGLKSSWALKGTALSHGKWRIGRKKILNPFLFLNKEARKQKQELENLVTLYFIRVQPRDTVFYTRTSLPVFPEVVGTQEAHGLKEEGEADPLVVLVAHNLPLLHHRSHPWMGRIHTCSKKACHCEKFSDCHCYCYCYCYQLLTQQLFVNTNDHFW